MDRDRVTCPSNRRYWLEIIRLPFRFFEDFGELSLCSPVRLTLRVLGIGGKKGTGPFY